MERSLRSEPGSPWLPLQRGWEPLHGCSRVPQVQQEWSRGRAPGQAGRARHREERVVVRPARGVQQASGRLARGRVWRGLCEASLAGTPGCDQHVGHSTGSPGQVAGEARREAGDVLEGSFLPSCVFA